MENCEFRTNQQFARRVLAFLAAGLLFLWLAPGRLGGMRQFGIAAGVVAIVGWSLLLVPRWSFLRIEDEGIFVSSPFWRQFISFDSVEFFEIVTTGQSLFYSNLVRLEFVGYVALAGSPLCRVRGARFCLRFYGCHGVLPLVDGISTARLMSMLNDRLPGHRHERA